MMKKEIKIAIAVVLSIWFFVMGFELGIYKERKANAETKQEVVNTVNPVQSTTTTVPSTPSTTIPTTIPTTVPTSGSDNTSATATTGTSGSTQPTSQNAVSNDPASMSKQQVITKVNEYMAALKAEQNVTAHKSENITVNVTDCSIPAAIDLINNIISGLAGSEEIDYTVTNGATSAGESMYALIPPTNKDFVVSDAGVLSAKAAASGTDTVYTVILVEESTTVNAPIPTYNSTAIGYLDLTSLDLTGVTIEEADMKYPGSTVEITVNAEGKVTKLVNKMPMTGYGLAQISFFSGNASFDGALDEEWTFTY